jgi:hypothetical protein
MIKSNVAIKDNGDNDQYIPDLINVKITAQVTCHQVLG